MISDLFWLAFTSMKKRGLRSWLTMLGIVIGVSAVVSLVALGEGLRLAILGQFAFLSTDVITIQASGVMAGPPGQGVIKPLLEHYVEDVERIPGVEMAIGRVIEDTSLAFNGRTDFTYAGSMPDGERRREVERIAQLELHDGQMLQDGDRGKVVLGSNYGSAERFGKAVRPRDEVAVHGKEFTVAGLLKKKGSFIVDNIVLMQEEEMIELFDINDTYDIIVAKIASGVEMGEVKARIERYLREERDVEEGQEDFSVESADQQIKDLDATLFAVQIFVAVIAGISILVGGIGISNTMYTSVVERTKQIGIMKSLGATNHSIFTLFLVESGFLGFVGGVLGILIGVGLAYGVKMVGAIFLGSELIQIHLSLFLLFGALVFSAFIGILSGLLPAVQASHLHPVEALRKTT